jgi:hypothetical protein
VPRDRALSFAICGATAEVGPVPMTFLAAFPSQTEAAFMAQVIKFAKSRGWACYHVHDSRHSEPGFPDLVVVKRPRVIFAELKSDRGKVTQAQRAWIDELRACGQEVYIWRPHHWQQIQKLLL